MPDYSKWFAENRNKWSWMPGMVDAVSGYRVHSVRDGVATGVIENTELGYGVYVRVVTDGIPDISDPATQGCLEAQIQEQFPGFHIPSTAHQMGPFWRLHFPQKNIRPQTLVTRADVLLAALEAI